MFFCTRKSTESFTIRIKCTVKLKFQKYLFNYSIWRAHLCTQISLIAYQVHTMAWRLQMYWEEAIWLLFSFTLAFAHQYCNRHLACLRIDGDEHKDSIVRLVWFVGLYFSRLFLSLSLLNVRMKRAIRWHSSNKARERSNNEKSLRNIRKLIFFSVIG